MIRPMNNQRNMMTAVPRITFLPTAAPVTLMPVLLDILLFPCASVITGENDNRILLQT
jgi:hypothetical protein